MGDYDNALLRSDNAPNVPEAVDTMLRKTLSARSMALQIFPIIPMSTQQTRMPILSSLPSAFFVNGDTGLKKTTKQAWDNKFINAEELAVILPIPEAVLDDSGFDIWAATVPHMQNAVARAIDDAIFFGSNRPSSWGPAIAPESIARSHTAVRGTNNAAAGGIAADFNTLYSLVEVDGYDVDFVLANRTYKGFLRNARDADGNHQTDVTPASVYDVEVSYPMRGLWPAGASVVSAIAGNREEGIIGLRQDFDYKFLSEAVITDNTGAIIFNLPQQDMIALRITFRLGWEVANVINYDNANEATRWPFAVMREPA